MPCAWPCGRGGSRRGVAMDIGAASRASPCPGCGPCASRVLAGAAVAVVVGLGWPCGRWPGRPPARSVGSSVATPLSGHPASRPAAAVCYLPRSSDIIARPPVTRRWHERPPPGYPLPLYAQAEHSGGDKALAGGRGRCPSRHGHSGRVVVARAASP